MARITISYSDGRYGFCRVPEGTPPDPRHVEVPDSTLALWEEISRLDRMVDNQLMQLNEELDARLYPDG